MCFGEVLVVLRLYVLLIGDMFEGFLHHSIEFSFTPERHDDVFAHLGVEAHQTQTCTAADQVADLGVSIFDASSLSFVRNDLRTTVRP